jgi:hypothetical protein
MGKIKKLPSLLKITITDSDFLGSFCFFVTLKPFKKGNYY